MKKLLATILLGAISVSSVFAFTACNPDVEEEEKQKEEQTETVETKATVVTEDKWKEALSYLTVDWDEGKMMPILSDNPRTSFSCKYVTDYVDGTFETNVYFDYDKLASQHEYLDYNENVEHIYAWKGGEVYYVVGPGRRVDSETGEVLNIYNKREYNREGFLKELDEYIYAYAGGEQILVLALADKYENFTYSEEKEEYTATIYHRLYEGDVDVTLKFENDRLVNMSVSVVGGEYVGYVFHYDYTYGISITVPEYFLNLHEGENIRN